MKHIMFVIMVVLVLSFTGVGYALDLGGRVITIDTRNNDITPLGDRGEYDWLNPDARLKAHIESVEQMFNCKIVFTQLPRAGVGEYLMTEVLAGGVPADVFISLQHDAPLVTLGREGFLHPLNDIVTEEFISRMPKMHQSLAVGRTYRGKHYGFTGELLPLSNVRLIMFNKDIFDAEGIPYPYDLVESKDWTWDVFREICYATTKDTDGDGTIDQWGASNYWGQNRWSAMVDWNFSNGAELVREVDGRMVYAYNDERAVEGYEFWAELAQAGVVVMGNQPARTRNGQIAMTIIATHTLATDAIQNVPYNWGVVPIPLGPKGENYVYPRSMAFAAHCAIPITVQDPEIVLEVLNALYQLNDKYLDVEAYNARAYRTLEMMVPDRESLRTVLEAYENPYPWQDLFPYFITYPLQDIWQPAIDGRDVWSGMKTPAVALNEIVEAVQTHMDEWYGYMGK